MRALRAGVVALIVIAMQGVAPGAAHGQVAESDPYSLTRAVTLARQRNPIVRAEGLTLEVANYDVRRARSVRGPTIDFNGTAGLVPAARGNAFESPDQQTDLDGLGPFYRVDLTLVQPLFTFGKIASLTDAATARASATAASREQVLDRLGLSVARAYWAVLAADQSRRVAAELSARYDDLIEEVSRRAQSDDYETDDVDVFEARSNRFDIERVRLESEQAMALATRRLGALMFLDWDAPVEVAEAGTPAFELTESDVPALVDLAELQHPRLLQARAALAGAEAALRRANAQSKPDVFMSGFFRWAHAGNRTDQKNPFVVDNFNFRSLGYYVGVRWDLRFDQHRLQAARERAATDAASARVEALRREVALQVDEAFREALKNVELLRAAGESRAAAEDGLLVSLDLWELGIGQVFRLLRLYERYFRLQQLEIEREFELNVSLAELALVTGDFDRYFGWLEAGVVRID